jgi:hypothetical protein
MEWHLGTEVARKYRGDMGTFLPATYKGQTATVMAIQLNDMQKAPTANALGEPIKADSMVNPYFNFIVKLAGGQIAMTAAYPNTIELDVKLASEENACGFTDLYSTDATQVVTSTLSPQIEHGQGGGLCKGCLESTTGRLRSWNYCAKVEQLGRGREP